MISRCSAHTNWLSGHFSHLFCGEIAFSAEIDTLTQITAVVETVGTASIADTLFALLELLEEAKVTGNCVMDEETKAQVCWRGQNMLECIAGRV